MKLRTLVLVLGVCALAAPGLAATPSPYAGEQSRSIKALSGEDIAALTKGEVTPDNLAAETTAIGDLEGRLRSVHSAAHLETRALLTPDQRAR